MKTAPYGAPEHDNGTSRRRRRSPFPRARAATYGPVTALLLALLVGAIGFYVGIRVEKSQLPSTASTGSTGPGRAGRGPGRARDRQRAPEPAVAAWRVPSAPAGGGGGNSSFGTISAVNGNTLFLTDASGNTVKVAVSSATTITKSLGVSARSVHPGDTVIVSGLKGSNGTISATTVNDTGDRSAASGSSGSSSSSGSASSAVSSLFGSGSGG